MRTPEQILDSMQVDIQELRDAFRALPVLPSTPVPTEPPAPAPVVVPATENGKVSVRNNLDIDASLASCRWLRPDVWQFWQAAAHTIRSTYQNRKALQMELIDACALQGHCGGHPIGAHSDHGRAVDIHYYTMGETNHTELKAGGKLVMIYDDWGPDGKLTDMFDVQRNLDLALAFLKRFPNGQLRSDPRIKAKLQYAARDYAEAVILGRIMADGPPHDLHWHADCGN